MAEYDDKDDRNSYVEGGAQFALLPEDKYGQQDRVNRFHVYRQCSGKRG
jgi:hypothetical protein